MTNILRAYHGDPQLKAKLLAELQKHYIADQIIKGTYGEVDDDDDSTFRGCAVGCTLHAMGAGLNERHDEYPALLGIPETIARLQDTIFEGLPQPEHREWPRQFSESITEGADLSLVWPRFAVWTLMDEKHGVRQYANTDEIRGVIDRVVGLYQRIISGATVDESEFRSAAAAAYAAAAAADAAYAADAADAAAYAAFWRAARNELVRLLGNAPQAIVS